MSDETKFRNIGPTSEAWLTSVGIRCRDDLASAGVVPAFLMVRDAGHNPSLNLLWALQGALLDVDWRSISDADKQKLRVELAAGEETGRRKSRENSGGLG